MRFFFYFAVFLLRLASAVHRKMDDSSFSLFWFWFQQFFSDESQFRKRNHSGKPRFCEGSHLCKPRFLGLHCIPILCSNVHPGKSEVVTLSIGIAHFLNSWCLYLKNPSASQRDLHFLIFRCHKSSACSVFYSEIYVFLFPAVINLLPARFSTAGFTFSYFPLS